MIQSRMPISQSRTDAESFSSNVSLRPSFGRSESITQTLLLAQCETSLLPSIFSNKDVFVNGTNPVQFPRTFLSFFLACFAAFFSLGDITGFFFASRLFLCSLLILLTPVKQWVSAPTDPSKISKSLGSIYATACPA